VTGEETPSALRGRNLALDGLRGVAALIVVLGHTLGGLPIDIFAKARFAGGPFGLVVNGDAAVHVFFVLSGLVLSASLVRNHETGVRGLPGYFVRRVFRLHPPYVAAVLFAWCATHLYPDGPVPTKFIEDWGHVRLSPQQLIPLVLQPPGAAAWLLPVGWTLRVESIFSALLPVMVAAMRFHMIAFAIVMLLVLRLPLPSHWAYFAVDFAFGMMLSDPARLAIARTKAVARLAIAGFFVGLVLLHLPNALHMSEPGDFLRRVLLIEATGAALVVAGVLYASSIERFLSHRFFLYLGRISYSFYLVHIPVVIVIGSRLTTNTVPMNIAGAAACILTSMAVATVMQRLVEEPSQELGRRFAKSVDRALF